MTRWRTILLLASMLMTAFVDAARAFDSENPPKPVLLTWTPPPLASSQRATRIVIDKSWRMMMLESKGQILRVYTIGLGDDPIGHKEQRGDSRTPEGTYRIDFKHPTSKFHLSMRISYPNDKDRARARKMRVHPGSDIMIHGTPNGVEWWRTTLMERDWTDGCVAVTNREIEEIWSMVQVGTRVDIRP